MKHAKKFRPGSRAAEPKPAPAKSAKPKAATRVLIVDDHPLFTTVLAEVLQEAKDFEVVGTAGDGPAAIEQIKALAPDLLVLDLMLPGSSGLELLQTLQAARLPTKTVVCSGAHDDQAIEMAFALGACSFVGKEAPISELVAVLRQVARGEPSITSRAAGVLRETLMRADSTKRIHGRDLAILRRLAMRHSIKEIAASMGLSIAAIYKARTRIGQRFGAQSPADFQRAAARLGLISGSEATMPPGQPATGSAPPAEPNSHDRTGP